MIELTQICTKTTSVIKLGRIVFRCPECGTNHSTVCKINMDVCDQCLEALPQVIELIENIKIRLLWHSIGNLGNLNITTD